MIDYFSRVRFISFYNKLNTEFRAFCNNLFPNSSFKLTTLVSNWAIISLYLNN